MGLWTYYQLRAEYATARELGERLLSQAENAQDSGLLVEAHFALGTTLFFQGELSIARAHLEQVLALYDSKQHHAHAFIYGLDPGIRGLALSAWILWYQGYVNQARKRSQEGLALAREMSHPLCLAGSQVQTAELHQFRREAQLAQEYAEAAITLSTEQGFAYWSACGTAVRVWALAEQGNSEEGIARIHQGLTAYQATGAELARLYFLALLAETYGNTGQAEAGLSVLAEALAIVDQTGEQCYEAELYRLKGELLHPSSLQTRESTGGEEADVCFHKAIAVARHQGAKSLELRATLSLARLWQRQGKAEAARQRLAEIYTSFTEGFDIADLRQAKALLDELP